MQDLEQAIREHAWQRRESIAEEIFEEDGLQEGASRIAIPFHSVAAKYRTANSILPSESCRQFSITASRPSFGDCPIISRAFRRAALRGSVINTSSVRAILSARSRGRRSILHLLH